jgi:hypothetical protein
VKLFCEKKYKKIFEGDAKSMGVKKDIKRTPVSLKPAKKVNKEH